MAVAKLFQRRGTTGNFRVLAKMAVNGVRGAVREEVLRLCFTLQCNGALSLIGGANQFELFNKRRQNYHYIIRRASVRLCIGGSYGEGYRGLIYNLDGVLAPQQKAASLIHPCLC